MGNPKNGMEAGNPSCHAASWKDEEMVQLELLEIIEKRKVRADPEEQAAVLIVF
jgi:hypothetical protein